MADSPDEVVEEEPIDEEKDVEDEVKELKEEFAKLKKESAGKDRKISEYQKKLDEKEEKPQRKKKDDLSKIDDIDELRRAMERQIDEAWDEAQKEVEKEKTKTIDQQYKYNALEAITQVDNLDSALATPIIKLMTLDKTADVDDISGAIQVFTSSLNDLLKKHRVILGNRERTSIRPVAGDMDITKVPSERTWAKWSPDQRDTWARNATPEQLEKIQYRT